PQDTQPRPQSLTSYGRRSESRDQSRRRNGFLHAGLPHLRRDAAPPRGGIWRRGGDPAPFGRGGGHRRKGRARGHPAVVGQLAPATASDPADALLRQILRASLRRTMSDADDVAAYYALGLERDRLANGTGALEFARTRELLERYLPPPPAVVADVGGGPGRYAIWLAERGYRVHLVDPIAMHVEQAKTAARDRPGTALASAEVGDARNLRLPDASADAVLLLGPLYHLPERADRLRALAEARRVCRPGGVVFAAAISRFASTLDGLRSGYLEDPAFAAVAAADRQSGRHRNPTR